jgi:hypothetical protein
LRRQRGTAGTERLQRAAGNHAIHRLVSASIQSKLTIGPPDDEHEREADRVADDVMRMPASTEDVRRATPMVQRQCRACEAAASEETASAQAEERSNEDAPRVQATRAGGNTPDVSADVDAYVRGRNGHGRPLDVATRQDFEARFGRDFASVRVHDDAAAAASARAIDARAYTVGHHVVFGVGEYAPTTSSGRRLLAHELTHVAQQGRSPAAARPARAIQRQPDIRRDDKPPEPAKPKPANLHFVVGDNKLNVGGGVFLKNLEALRSELLKTSPPGGQWTLSITMHGAETFFATSGEDAVGGITETHSRAYNKSKVQKIFGDKAFQEWRKDHGPKQINLLSCQVGPDLENAFLKLVQHPSSSQTAVGVGEGCLLLITPVEARFSGAHIRTRAQYDKLSASGQSSVLKTLTKLNDDFGYGGAKVTTDILDRYFEVGLWLKVEVITKKSKKLVPAMTRTNDSDFNIECAPGSLKKRVPNVPVPADEAE